MTILVYVWLIGTVIVGAVLLGAAIAACAFAVERKRPAALLLALGLFIGAGVSFVANPLVNLLVFHGMAEARAGAMVADMRGRDLIGSPSEALVQAYGKPHSVRTAKEYEVWYYDPNPWFMASWTQVAVRVENGRVAGHWLDD